MFAADIRGEGTADSPAGSQSAPAVSSDFGAAASAEVASAITGVPPAECAADTSGSLCSQGPLVAALLHQCNAGSHGSAADWITRVGTRRANGILEEAGALQSAAPLRHPDWLDAVGPLPFAQYMHVLLRRAAGGSAPTVHTWAAAQSGGSVVHLRAAMAAMLTDYARRAGQPWVPPPPTMAVRQLAVPEQLAPLAAAVNVPWHLLAALGVRTADATAARAARKDGSVDRRF